MRRAPLKLLLIVMGLLAGALSESEAACDLPTLPPGEVATIPQDGGAQLHVEIGTIGVCDMGLRAFDIALPNAGTIQNVKVQLALAGFIRHYGVRQIGFTLRSVDAGHDQNGVNVRYTAAIDGLDRYQLAYTLYVTEKP